MSLLSVNQLTLVQGIKTLIDNATFGVAASDKIAIVGPNGCGKTTLLTLLSKVKTESVEGVVCQKGLRITFLRQTQDFNPDDSISDHLFQSNSRASVAIRRYQLALSHSENPNSEDELVEAMSEMDQANAWEYEARVSSILSELKLSDLSLKMKDLSGGMQKKIALAQAFFEDCELLILDEPTNHLDIETIEWLENTLKRYQSAILMVTHDRYFLDKVCTKIIEIDACKLYVHEGNYPYYLEQRNARYAAQEKHNQTLQSILRIELAWLRQGPKARSTKQRARKQRIEGLQSIDKSVSQEGLELSVANRRLGKKILEIKAVDKSFESKPILSEFSYTFKLGERLGIVGPNGVGKTTLLNLITGRLSPDAGEVDPGVNTVFGYFDQHSFAVESDQTVYEHVADIGNQIKLHDDTVVSASQLLERFLFPSAMLKTPIAKLSGGEKRRLHLVCLLLKNPNFLVFDEPTNDLDIQTLSVLEDFLINFSGCVIVISHDRYFMDRVVNQILVIQGPGDILSFPGNYSDYLQARDEGDERLALKLTPIDSSRKPDAVKSTPQPAIETKKKLTNKEREEFKRIEKEIELFETEKSDLDSFFEKGEGNPDTFAERGKRLTLVMQTLESHYKRWEYLAEFS